MDPTHTIETGLRGLVEVQYCNGIYSIWYIFVPKRHTRKGNKLSTREGQVPDSLIDATGPVDATKSVRRQLELDPPVCASSSSSSSSAR